MSAARYNELQMTSGALEHRHLVPAVELLQAELAERGLYLGAVDGYFGPKTREAWRRAYEPTPAAMPSPLSAAALQIAMEELGNGEEGGNNRGEDLHRYRDWPHGDDYSRSVGEWCAFFHGYCWEQAALRINVNLPFRRRFYDTGRNRLMPVGSAKWLGDRIAEAGRKVSLAEAIAGDVCVFNRGRDGTPSGHIAFFLGTEGDYFFTIDGNVGNPPAKVKKVRRLISEPGQLLYIARIEQP